MEYVIWDNDDNCYKTYDQLAIDDMLLNLSTEELYWLDNHITEDIIRRKFIMEGAL